MRAIQKITKQGNSAMVTLPRPLMFKLGWLPGEMLVLDWTEDGVLTIRAWKSTEMLQGQSPGVITDRPGVLSR